MAGDSRVSLVSFLKAIPKIEIILLFKLLYILFIIKFENLYF